MLIAAIHSPDTVAAYGKRNALVTHTNYTIRYIFLRVQVAQLNERKILATHTTISAYAYLFTAQSALHSDWLLMREWHGKGVSRSILLTRKHSQSNTRIAHEYNAFCVASKFRCKSIKCDFLSGAMRIGIFEMCVDNLCYDEIWKKLCASKREYFDGVHTQKV